MKINRLFLLALLGAALLLPTFSCKDIFDEEENQTPSWLGENIYDYLKSRGDCNYYIRLIDDCGLKSTMQLSGSNTVFFSNDKAFNRFFKTNTLGINRYEDIPYSMKKIFLRIGVVENAQLIERLSYSDHGQILLRRTTSMEVSDTIPVVSPDKLPVNNYFAPYRKAGKPMYLLQDATPWTLVQFFPEVMSQKGITAGDFNFISGHHMSSSLDSAYLYGTRIVKQDIICKNGYLHELEDLLLPPDNMAGYIRSNKNLSRFNSLLDRFCCPVYYGRTTNHDSIFQLRYFNTGSRSYTTDPKGISAPGTLIYDPGWNLYASTTTTGTQNGYEQTMGCLFVPTNEALDAFFSPTGDGSDFYNAFGSWDKVPNSMVADILNSHMKNNFLTALPSQFDKIEDENGYSMDVKSSNIVGSYIARNGLVYVTNKVFPPQDYRTVMGPAKIDTMNALFNKAITNTSYSYFAYLLRAPQNVYHFFVTPDLYMKNYKDPVAQGYTSSDWKCNLNFYLNASNQIAATPIRINNGQTIVSDNYPLGARGIVTGCMKNRINDILNTHTIVMDYDGELEEDLAAGQEYFISNGYAPIHITANTSGGEVAGAGNTNSLTIKKVFKKTNGKTYIVDGIIQNTTTSIYDILSSHTEFSAFFDICNELGLFSTRAANGDAALDYKVSFLNQYHYTVYVPTNAAILQAQRDGVIPTLEAYRNEGDAALKDAMAEKLTRFIRYHFQDNAIFIKGKKETTAYLTSTLNTATNKFYPVTVQNTGDAITLTGANYGKATVVTSGGLFNLMARDIVVNSKVRDQATEIETYSYAVIHQIDHYLYFNSLPASSRKRVTVTKR
ncbi:MAG: fasciclin domain-containing protein [Bacteroidota bacterium]|nr:fasciclin domain-containing protein [Bacteroidota bacterium]